MSRTDLQCFRKSTTRETFLGCFMTSMMSWRILTARIVRYRQGSNLSSIAHHHVLRIRSCCRTQMLSSVLVSWVPHVYWIEWSHSNRIERDTWQLTASARRGWSCCGCERKRLTILYFFVSGLHGSKLAHSLSQRFVASRSKYLRTRFCLLRAVLISSLDPVFLASAQPDATRHAGDDILCQ